jgi:general secretion pathway protein A
MYCKHFNLNERPFNVTADPSFFFSSDKHKEALSHLLYGVSQRKGVIVITGEVGTGKTTLCRFFLDHLGDKVKTAFILNPFFSEMQLLEAIIKDFGIEVKNKTRFNIIGEFNKFLLRETEAGSNVVLIIDEAQNLKPLQLEQIRLLSNLETSKDKLVQLVLVGQPELNHRLSLNSLRQLEQRVVVRYHITPLNTQEVKDYINHRLDIAGSNNQTVSFTEDAYQKIFDFSNGTPRLINILCDRALLAAFTAEKNTIDIDTIIHCIDEMSNYYGSRPG